MPIEDRSKDLKDLKIRQNVLPVQSFSNKDGMFQNRQSAQNRNEKLKQTSSLSRLDPFLDERELHRVGGRLQKAALAYKIKHPVVMPKKSHANALLIRQYHSREQGHQGCGMTHNTLRQASYWIINGRSSVSHQLRKCIRIH